MSQTFCDYLVKRQYLAINYPLHAKRHALHSQRGEFFHERKTHKMSHFIIQHKTSKTLITKFEVAVR